MEVFFLETPKLRHLAAFQQTYARQNLKSLRFSAQLFIGLCSSVFLLSFFFPFLGQMPNVSFYRAANILLISASAAVLFLEFWLIGVDPATRPLKLVQTLCMGFGMLFILNCMSFSFIAQYNPKNTLTFYLLGLITVAFLWNFEYYESLLIALLTGLAFAVGLHFTTLSAEQKIMNHCVSFFILVAFFVISRIMYSYRATHFDQFKEIEAKNQEVQQVSRAKSEILGVVAHDLRSPFATIEMLATVLQQGNLSLQEERQYLELIQTSCQTSRHIINEILEVAHEQKPQEFPLEKANLCQFLQEIHQEWQLQLQGSRQLVFLRPTKPVYAQVNKERLQRVLNNLLSNALKFTSEKSEIQIQLKETDKKVLLEVRDQGIGIPKDLTPYLFDRFSAARRKGLNGEKSIGLGLSICRELVEQHGGSIEVESNESQGTTFVITLPALN